MAQRFPKVKKRSVTNFLRKERVRRKMFRSKVARQNPKTRGKAVVSRSRAFLALDVVRVDGCAGPNGSVVVKKARRRTEGRKKGGRRRFCLYSRTLNVRDAGKEGKAFRKGNIGNFP